MVETTRTVDETTGLECDAGSVRRFDKIQGGDTVSDGCVKRANYMRWSVEAVDNLSEGIRSEIWDKAQVSRKTAQTAFPWLRSGVITLVIRLRQKIVEAAMREDGWIIHDRFKALGSCVTTGIEFGLSGEAVKWIISALEKAREGIDNACLNDAAHATKLKMLDEDYLRNLRCLRATVEDTGWGKRQQAIFNSDELSISKTGVKTGSIMGIVRWMKEQTFLKRETTADMVWLNDTMAETIRSRKEQRRSRATAAEVERLQDG
jgi:hypothetical protein